MTTVESAHSSLPHPDRRLPRSTYIKRRVATAVGALMLPIVAAGAVGVLKDAHDRQYGTDVPATQDLDRDNVTTRVVKPGETLRGIAREYTPDNHRVDNNLENFQEQREEAGREGILKAGESLVVPETTIPEDK